MDARNKITNIQNTLANTDYKNLFGIVSPVHFLSAPPMPLSTEEMHRVSGEIIRQAKREVLLEFYKINFDSDGGMEIYSALKALKTTADKDKTNINVFMLVNSRGTLAEKIYKENTAIKLEGLENSEYFNFKLTLHPTAAFGTLHTKMIIVDSEIAMIRSGDPDSLNDLEKEFVETAMLIKGPIVLNMREDYNEVWRAYYNEPLPETPLQDKKSFGGISIPSIFFSKRENGNPISLYYSSCESPYKIALLQAISDTKTSIHIMTSNFNDYGILDELANACNRNISVKIITGMHHNDSTESWWGGTNFTSMAYLVKNIKSENLKNLEIRWATKSSDQDEIVNHGDKCTIHAKYICIDNELIFIGSSPLDVQGMKYSREADIVFQDEETAKSFESKFFNDRFSQGKDFFEESYYTIHNEIELQITRIKDTATTNLQRNKCHRLLKVLKEVSTSDYPSWRGKTCSLIESTLPIFAISTGNKPGYPASYNTVYSWVEKYGLGNHISIQTDVEQTSQMANEIDQFFLIPSNSASRLRKRAVSTLASSPTEHELSIESQNEKSERNELRKSY